MEDMNFDFLRFVEYKELGVWDYKQITNSHSYSSKFPLIPFGDILEDGNIIWEEISDKKEYPILGVRSYGQGVYLNRVAKGKELTMRKYQKSQSGYLFWCKVRTVKGQFGIITEKYANTYGSSNMQYMKIKLDKVLPSFLLLLFHKNALTDYMDTLSIGADGRHFNKSTFLKVKCPIPKQLEIQQLIVKKHNQTIERAIECERKATELEAGIDKLLFDELGIKHVPDLSKLSSQSKFFKLVDFKELIHWNAKKSTLEIKPKDMFVSEVYPNVILSQYAAINPATDFSELHPDDTLTFLPMECISDIYGEIETKYKGDISKIKGYTHFKDGDVLFAKITPCMQNGKCVIANGLLNGYGYGSTEYHVIRPKSEEITGEYIHLFLRTSIARTLAQEFFTGSAGQQRVGEDFLRNVALPLPPVEIQHSIAGKISAIKQKIKALRTEAQAFRAKAEQDFEEEVFEVSSGEA